MLLILTISVKPAEITLSWDYPTNELSSNTTFVIYTQTNVTVPLTNWYVIGTVIATQTICKVTMVPESRYFYVIASNIWGQYSEPSNIANTPTPVTNVVNLTITKP